MTGIDGNFALLQIVRADQSVKWKNQLIMSNLKQLKLSRIVIWLLPLYMPKV